MANEQKLILSGYLSPVRRNSGLEEFTVRLKDWQSIGDHLQSVQKVSNAGDEVG